MFGFLCNFQINMQSNSSFAPKKSEFSFPTKKETYLKYVKILFNKQINIYPDFKKSLNSISLVCLEMKDPSGQQDFLYTNTDM